MGPDQKIRVCHIISGDLWAGAEVQAYELIRSLVKEPRLELRAILLNERKLSERLRALGIEIVVIDEATNNFVRIFRGAREYLSGKEIDIIHSHRYKENILAGRLKKAGLARALVQTVHGAPESAGYIRRMKSGFYTYWNRRYTRKYFDRVITVSHDLEKKLAPVVGTDKIITVHNSIDMASVTPSRDSASVRKEFGLSPETPLIVAAGRMAPVKAYHILLKAASIILERLPQARVMLVGDGPERPSLEKLSRELGLADKVIFPGFRNDITDILGALDIMVISSNHEGIPMVVLETMALAKPVVSTAVGGMKEVIENEVSGLLVSPGDPVALASACLRLFDDSQLRSQLGEQGQQRIVKEFSIEKHRQRVTQIYMEVAGKL